MLHKESVLKAEVIWALEILVNSYFFRSSAGKGELFVYVSRQQDCQTVSNEQN